MGQRWCKSKYSWRESHLPNQGGHKAISRIAREFQSYQYNVGWHVKWGKASPRESNKLLIALFVTHTDLTLELSQAMAWAIIGWSGKH